MTVLKVTVTGEPGVQRKLSRAQGRPLQSAIRKGTRAGASMLVSPIRNEIKGAGLVLSGAFQKSVSARSLRKIGGYSVGPRDYKRHWLIRGTERGIEPHAVVDRAVDTNKPAVARKVADVILRGK